MGLTATYGSDTTERSVLSYKATTSMDFSWRRMRRLLGTFAVALVGLTTALTLGGAVSAHHPMLESQTDRPCGDDAPWTATVTSQSDRDWNKDWSSRHRVDDGARTAWSSLTDDQVPYVFQVGPFDATVTSTRVHVDARWYSKYDGRQSASATRGITITRPDTWICETPTTTTTTPTPGTPSEPGTPTTPTTTATTSHPGTPTTPATPDAPAVSYDCDTDQLVITGADDSDTVDYTVTVDQAPTGEASTWTVTIEATPQPGYRFPPDATTDWTFTDTVDCFTTTPPPAPPTPPSPTTTTTTTTHARHAERARHPHDPDHVDHARHPHNARHA